MKTGWRRLLKSLDASKKISQLLPMAKAKKKAPKKVAKTVAKAKSVSKPAKKAAPPKAKPVKKPTVVAKPGKGAKPVAGKKPAVMAKPDPKLLKKKAVEAKPEKVKVTGPVKGKSPQPEELKKGKKSGAEAKVSAAKAKPAPEEVEELIDDEEMELVAPEEVFLTDAEGRRLCRRRDCDQLASVEGYCRYHYLLFWKRIQQRKKILADGKLINYIEELTSRYPDKYLEMIAKDLRTEKDFMAALAELEIDESANEEGEFEEDNNFMDEVRGMSEAPHTREEEDF